MRWLNCLCRYTLNAAFPTSRKRSFVRLRRCRGHPPCSLPLPTVHRTVVLTRRAPPRLSRTQVARRRCYSLQRDSCRSGETRRLSRKVSFPHYAAASAGEIKTTARRRLALFDFARHSNFLALRGRCSTHL